MQNLIENNQKIYFIEKYKIDHKALQPFDFLELNCIVPFQIFICKSKPLGIWGQLQEAENKIQTNEKALIESYKIIFNIAITNEFNFDNFILQYGIEGCQEVFNIILFDSLKYFSKIYEIKKDTVLYINEIATTYGKTPIEILIPLGGYNDLESFLFNTFVKNIATEEQNRQIAKETREAKKNNRSRQF